MNLTQAASVSQSPIQRSLQAGTKTELKPGPQGASEGPNGKGDSVLISSARGIGKTFYGSVAGTGVGIVSFYTPIARPFAHAGAPKIVAIPAMLSGVATGVVAGHMAGSPGKAAAYGALGGAVLGAYFGYGAGSVATSVSGALIGALAGSVSGVVTAGVFPKSKG